MTDSNSTHWVALMRELGPTFAARSAEHDQNDSFVAENFALLKERGAFSAGVPAELGGGGASAAELSDMIRELARHCSSTGLALSMHTHLIAFQAYLYRSGNKAPEGLLRRVASEGVVLISTGGSDWLAGSGKLVKVDGGYHLSGRKIFASGVPAGDILMTTGVYDDPENGPTVFHFPVPLKSKGVTVLDTWRALGMRGTGSHDVELKDVFVPDAAMGGVRRPAGKWHPAMHAVALVATSVFNAAYVGVAQAARDLALTAAKKKADDPGLPFAVAELEQQVVLAELALASLMQLVVTEKPGPATTAAVEVRRTLLGNAVLAAVSKAMDVAGGSSFYRSAALERLFRDAQAVRYHPMQEKPAQRFVGRHLLGLDIDG